MRVIAADIARVCIYRAKFKTQTVEDAAVAGMHFVVGGVKAVLIYVKRVAIFHRELARTHHSEARSNLVAKLRLYLV